MRLLFLTLISCQLIAQPLTIAFGSCNNEYREQVLWDDIINQQPDLWIWMGDNIYGDTDDMTIMRKKYDHQKQNPDYQKLIGTVPIVGIWDDHDYGINDGGRHYAKKQASQKEFADFLGLAEDHPVRNQEGIYHSYIMDNNDIKIKVILLDTRYFRDTIQRVNRVYQPNFDGTLLGKEQWEWLEKELTGSDADIHLLVSSIQVISRQHAYEKWANFPNERERLYNLIASTEARGVIMLSGDRHIAEISEMSWPGIAYPLRDITSSGLTHTWSKAGKEANVHRISDLIINLNYGCLKFVKNDNKIEVTSIIAGNDGAEFDRRSFQYLLD